MNDHDKTNDELVEELQELHQEINYLKLSHNKYITRHKATETGLKKNRAELTEIIKVEEEVSEFAENIINTLRESLLILDQDLRVVKASRSFYNFFKVTTDETIGELIYNLGNNQWDIPELRELLETILPEKTTFDDYEVEHVFSTIGKRVMLLNARQIKRAFGKEKIILLAIEDITERKLTEESIKEQSRLTTEYLDILLDHAHAPIIIWDSSMVIKRFNHQFEQLSGYKSEEVIDKKIDILFPEDNTHSTLEALNKHLSDETMEVIEVDILTKDNDIRTVLWNSTHILDKEENTTVATIAQDITKRKQAEEKLRISEQQYRHLFENSPIGKMQTHIDGSLHANKAFSDLLGYSIDELKKLKWQDITHSDDIKESVKEYDNLLNGKSKFVRFTKRYIHKSGKTIWTDVTIALQKDAEGKPLFFHTYIIDITELKQVEDELVESERHYKTLFNEMDEGFCIIEIIFDKSMKPIDYRFLETNPAFEKQTGLINVQGKSVSELNPEYEKYWFETIAKVALTGQSIRFSNYTEKLDRFYDVYALRFGPPENLQVAVLFNDINERKKTEEKLRESEEQFRKLYENAKIGLYRTTPDGTILMANKALLNLLGFPSFELLATRNLQKDGFGPTFGRKEFLEKIEKYGEVNNFESEWIRLDGSRIIVQESAQAIRDSHNIIQYFDGVIEDITERKLASKALIEAKNKAEQSDRLKSAFLANMSHEIRTPLNGILGFTDLLKEPKLSGEEQQEYIKIIETSGKRMLNIISDIISISIVESGNLKTSISATNITEQNEFLYTFFHPEARQKGLEIFISKALPPNESIILTDKEKVNSILSNLIKNAIKFTQTGSIEFGCEKKGRYLEYYVKDTGVGIAKEKIEIIFERFRQGSEFNTRNYEGAGLGLSISKAYVEVLGGKIWVESEEGKGSTFYFNIPYMTDSKEKNVKKHTDIAIEPLNRPRKLKILIAEDDETSEMLLRIVVSAFSDEILKAETGLEAVEACRNNPDIDLVLMDIKMPVMDGLEATRQIRQFNKEVIIIAQTAYGMNEDKEIALKAGCNEYVSKPLDITLIRSLIQKHFYKKDSD